MLKLHYDQKSLMISLISNQEQNRTSKKKFGAFLGLSKGQKKPAGKIPHRDRACRDRYPKGARNKIKIGGEEF